VGLGIGLTLSLFHALLNWMLPSWVAGVLTAGLWAALTGGLHIDGLADTFDGLMVAAPKERRLAVLRDPRVGSYGVLGIVAVFGLKSSALADLPSWPHLVLPPVLGRWALLFLALSPQAREEGMGTAFHASLRHRDIIAAMLITALVTGLFRWQGLLAFVLVHIFLFLFVRAARGWIGGVTGDLLGAGCELVEALSLIALCLQVP
jgi:adenosylcobinamide-GDP ribazoletransferase